MKRVWLHYQCGGDAKTNKKDLVKTFSLLTFQMQSNINVGSNGANKTKHTVKKLLITNT